MLRGLVLACAIVLVTPQLCRNGYPFPSREGTHVRFAGDSLFHSASSADMRLYSESLTAQTFVYIENTTINST